MWVRFILHCFLLILIVSIIVLFVTLDWLSLHWDKTDCIQFTPVIAFSKRDYLFVWKLVEYTFNYQTYLCKGFRCERSKQTVNASQDWYKIPSCWNKLFRDKQILCLRQADYIPRNVLLINVIYQKLLNANGNTFSFIPHLCCFPYLIWIAKVGV